MNSTVLCSKDEKKDKISIYSKKQPFSREERAVNSKS